MVKTKINKECYRMSSKGKHKKKHRKDESSDIYVEDKKKAHKDESSDIYSEDKPLKKKKGRKDESSDIHVEDKKVKTHYFENNHQVELVYYDPAIIQEVDVFQDPAQNSLVSYQNDDDVEAVDHVVEALAQNFDDSGQVDEVLDEDVQGIEEVDEVLDEDLQVTEEVDEVLDEDLQVTEEFEDIDWDGKDE
jgi:hypothetical protein